jgi:hypothetical protein
MAPDNRGLRVRKNGWAFSSADAVRRQSVQEVELLESLKTGDKVRLKHLDNWVTAHDSALTVKRIGEFPEHGISWGALCEWISPKGGRLEKIYPIEKLIAL